MLPCLAGFLSSWRFAPTPPQKKRSKIINKEINEEINEEEMDDEVKEEGGSAGTAPARKRVHQNKIEVGGECRESKVKKKSIECVWGTA
mmetsp:Transcript_60860/g.70662  ORF Transcript_60860/g.70662 Transcript_60860/m.70662 type:complete len:89 (-) Transcript_60860:558-824(-)